MTLIISAPINAQEIIIHESPREQDLAPYDYNNGYDVPDTRYSSLEVRVLHLEENLRTVIGKFEEINHKMEHLEKKNALLANQINEREVKIATIKAQKKAVEKEKKIKASPPPLENSQGQVSPDALYKYSYNLLKDKKYNEAEISFRDFIKKFPNDKLTSNAYYWLGESFYTRGDYKSASLNFLKGYNKNKESNKAPDNLLKLAMSLNALGKDDDACSIFSQLESSFKKISPAIRKRIEGEQKKAGCN